MPGSPGWTDTWRSPSTSRCWPTTIDKDYGDGRVVTVVLANRKSCLHGPDAERWHHRAELRDTIATATRCARNCSAATVSKQRGVRTAVTGVSSLRQEYDPVDKREEQSSPRPPLSSRRQHKPVRGRNQRGQRADEEPCIDGSRRHDQRHGDHVPTSEKRISALGRTIASPGLQPDQPQATAAIPRSRGRPTGCGWPDSRDAATTLVARSPIAPCPIARQSRDGQERKHSDATVRLGLQRLALGGSRLGKWRRAPAGSPGMPAPDMSELGMPQDLADHRG